MEGIGKEICFTLDNFQQPRLLSPKETIARMILNLFLLRPGNIPSLPHIGIDIQSYLYRLEDDFDPEEIKEKIYTQCAEIVSFISLGDVKVFVAPLNGQDVLIVAIPIVGFEEDDSTLLLGFKQNEKNELSVAYEFQKAIQNI